MKHCSDLKTYVGNSEAAIADYSNRCRSKIPVASSTAEGCVDEIANARMGKKPRMRWSPRGAHRVWMSQRTKRRFSVRNLTGDVLSTARAVTDPDVIFRALSKHMGPIQYVVLETGRMANWLYNELFDRGLPVVCIDARQAHAVLSQMHNKTDDNDAAMLAELARTGFYKKVEVKSRVALGRRALLKARVNVENTIRGLLASFGLRLPKHLSTYEQRVHALLQDRPVLSGIILPLMELRTAALTKDMARYAKEDETCQRLMTIPGVGPVSAVPYVATIDDPQSFAKSRSVGAYLGLTSRRYQSDDMDFGGRISKRGDAMLRSTLYEAASSLLNRVTPGNGAGLQAWARALKVRTSHKKAVVALARKLAVLMHASWTNGSTFQPKEA